MWDGSWWGDIGIAGYKYSNSTINTYLYNMQKVHNTCVCNIYVHIFPRRNHSANIPWSKIPLFSPPPPPKKKVWMYIYIYIFTYLESHNLSNGFPRKVLMRKSSMLNLLKPWSRQASGDRTHPGGVPGDGFLPHWYVSLKLNHDQDDEIHVYSKRIYR